CTAAGAPGPAARARGTTGGRGNGRRSARRRATGDGIEGTTLGRRGGLLLATRILRRTLHGTRQTARRFGSPLRGVRGGRRRGTEGGGVLRCGARVRTR